MNDHVDELLAIERALMLQAERCNSTPIGRELRDVFWEAAGKVAVLRGRLQVAASGSGEQQDTYSTLATTI